MPPKGYILKGEYLTLLLFFYLLEESIKVFLLLMNPTNLVQSNPNKSRSHLYGKQDFESKIICGENFRHSPSFPLLSFEKSGS